MENASFRSASGKMNNGMPMNMPPYASTAYIRASSVTFSISFMPTPLAMERTPPRCPCNRRRSAARLGKILASHRQA
jgi:hypothetical protein